MLHEQRFWDAAPASVYAALLDEGRYLCSIATMYRLLRAAGETGDRRRHATHPARVKPELVATASNQVYSWDITKLHGPAKWTYYYLYVILDVFSRYVVGWMVAAREAASLAERLLADTIAAQGVAADQLSVHADRGTSMTSKPVAMLPPTWASPSRTPAPTCPMTTRSAKASSRPSSTIRPSPTGSAPSRTPAASARAFSRWYNHEHYHSGIALLTPADVHSGRAGQVTTARAWCWTAPTPPAPSGSSASHPPRPGYPSRCGSTSPSTQRRRLSIFLADVSH